MFTNFITFMNKILGIVLSFFKDLPVDYTIVLIPLMILLGILGFKRAVVH